MFELSSSLLPRMSFFPEFKDILSLKMIFCVFLYSVLKIIKIQLLSVFEGEKKIWERKLTIFEIIPMSFLPKHQMLLEKKYLP